MTGARVWLHGLAGLLAAALTLGSGFHAAASPRFSADFHDILPELIPVALIAVAAAQLSAWAGWRWLERGARTPHWSRAARAGLYMALLSHLLCGVLFMLCGLAVARGEGGPLELVTGGSGVALGNGFLVGWISIPLSMLCAVLIRHLRRRELVRAAA